MAKILNVQAQFHVKLQYVVLFAYLLLLYWEALSISEFLKRRRIR